MIPDSAPQLLTIGEFARQTRLTAKALRIYDEIGLLRPADIGLLLADLGRNRDLAITHSHRARPR